MGDLVLCVVFLVCEIVICRLVFYVVACSAARVFGLLVCALSGLWYSLACVVVM